MATKKNAQKTSKRANSNISTKSININKKSAKSAEKVIKNTSGKVFLLAFVFLVVGALIGVGAFWFVCKDDCFDLNGEDQIEFTLEENYVDEGVKIVAFGKDETQSVEIETNLTEVESGVYTASDVGTYYIKYKSTCFKYGTLFKVEKVRLITFVEASEGGE